MKTINRELDQVSKEKVIYTVHAFRYADRERHSYIVGVYPKKKQALDAAEAEQDWRGGNKYFCEIRKWVIGSENEDNSPGMPSKVIRGLFPIT